MIQSPHQTLFRPAKSVVLDGEENEIPITLIRSSYPKPLINKQKKEKALNFESEFSRKSFYPNFNTSQIYYEVMREKEVQFTPKVHPQSQLLQSFLLKSNQIFFKFKFISSVVSTIKRAT